MTTSLTSTGRNGSGRPLAKRASSEEVQKRLARIVKLVDGGMTPLDAARDVAKRLGVREETVCSYLRRHPLPGGVAELAEPGASKRGRPKPPNARPDELRERMIQVAILLARGWEHMDACREVGKRHGLRAKSIARRVKDDSEEFKRIRGWVSDFVRLHDESLSVRPLLFAVLTKIKEGDDLVEACGHAGVSADWFGYCWKAKLDLVNAVCREIGISPLPEHRGRGQMSIRTWIEIHEGARFTEIYGGNMKEAARRLGYPERCVVHRTRNGKGRSKDSMDSALQAGENWLHHRKYGHPDDWQNAVEAFRNEYRLQPGEKLRGVKIPKAHVKAPGEFQFQKKSGEETDNGKPWKSRVTLRGEDRKPVIDGEEVPKLTAARYHVVQALIEAGGKRLTLQSLKDNSGHGDAHKMLKALAESHPLWKTVLLFPSVYGEGYGIA